jgi:hypothetical protein
MPTTAPRSRTGHFACPALLLLVGALAQAQTPSLDDVCTALINHQPEAVFAYKIAIDGPVQCKAEGDTLTLELTGQQNGPPVIRKSVVALKANPEGKITSFDPAWMLSRPVDAVFKPVAELAADLGDNNGPAALSAFDPAMKQYGDISNDLDALTTQTDVLCAIDIVDDNQTDGVHTLDTDWYLELKSRADAGPTERRRERVRLRLELKKNKWRITDISPLNILAPIKVN